MRNLELMLLLEESELADVGMFRNKIPELAEAELTNYEIKCLYELFSEDRYSAQWLGTDADWVVEEFRNWLLEENEPTKI